MWSVLSILANIVYILILNASLYTDRAAMPNGEIREWHHSPLYRLSSADQMFLFYFLLVCIAVSAVTAILKLAGMRSDTVHKVWLISSILSAAVFFLIMIITGNTHVKYA